MAIKFFIPRYDENYTTLAKRVFGSASFASYVKKAVEETPKAGKRCPYYDTADKLPIKSDIPGAPDTCPQCEGWL